MNTITDKKLMAFWPCHNGNNCYFCSGIVTDMNDRGHVETLEYGSGTYFNPIKILPKSVGMKLKEELDALEEKHDAECKSLREKQVQEIHDVVIGLLPFDIKSML